MANEIQAHAYASEQAIKDLEALTAHRSRVALIFETLTDAVTGKLRTPDFASLSSEALEGLEIAVCSQIESVADLMRAQEAARLAVAGTRSVRDAANRDLDLAEQINEAAFEKLAAEISASRVGHDYASPGPSDTAEIVASKPTGNGTTSDIDSDPSRSENVGVPPGIMSSPEGHTRPLEDSSRLVLEDSKPLKVDEPCSGTPVALEPMASQEDSERSLAPLGDAVESMIVMGLNGGIEPESLRDPEEEEALGLTEPTPLDQTDGTQDAPDAPITSLQRWDDWIGIALRQGHYALALHLADGRHLAGADVEQSLAPAVIEGLLRGVSVQVAYNRQWAAYEDLKNALMSAAQQADVNDAANLLIFTSAIKPAMLQSESARELLTALEGDVAAMLNPLRAVVQNVAAQRLNNIVELAASPGEAERQRRSEDIRTRLQTWSDAAFDRKTNYQQATAVWLELVVSTGPIGQAMKLALDGKEGASVEVATLIERLEEHVDRVIDDAHVALSKGPRKEAIEGIARKQLRGLIDSAISLLQDWLQVRQELGPRDDRFRSHRDALLTAIDQALVTMAQHQGTRELETAKDVFKAVMCELAGHLRGVTSLPAVVDDLLDWEIALLPNFPLNARRGLRIEATDSDDLAAAAAADIHQDILSPEAAFSLALVLGNLSSAERLADKLAEDSVGSPAERILLAATNARRALVDRRKLLRQRLDDLQIAANAGDTELDDLERAMTSFEQLQLDTLPLNVGDRRTIADFPLAARELDRIERLVERIRAPQIASLEGRIAALESKHQQRLDDCWAQLERGDLGTLAEEVDQIEKHGVVESAEAAPLATLQRFAHILRLSGDKPAVPYGNLPKAAREGAVLGEFDFSALLTLDRERASTLLEVWNSLLRAIAAPIKKHEKDEGPARVGNLAAQLLRAIGFTGVNLAEYRKESNWFNITVSTVPLRSRDDCPVPVFGSERIHGPDRMAHYAVIVVAPRDIDACISLFERLPDHALLFLTDALDRRQRRDIQRRARRSTRSIAVADSVTIATLATIKDSRTKQFFELAIPFGNAQPYADTGSDTAIENFFGRENELRTLVEPRGACFVYGGRQLGKTALLRQIELRENDNDDRVAVYCYIKPVGESEPNKTVWDTIRFQLENRGVSLPKAPTVAEQLRGWVQQKAGRYLLIMLDEADAFLSSEMEANFPIIEQMKALMESTLRSVKFVFAGLHNVQRFYRAPNSPLLHLGMPVNVGPLLGSDRQAARQMAIEPMAALGFAFEDKLDAYHMLSLVGFYPSLMQSFGKAVVNAVNTDLASSTNSGNMPVLIRRSVIDAAFNDQSFRKGVVERLLNTLKLDERYELITYAVWERMQEDSHAGLSTAFGYPAPEIWRLARSWWPAGFAETDSLESFSAILDEMDEMGVLARKGDLYALRSQRIAAMLGGSTEIEHRLQDLIERTPRRRPDPLTNRRRVGARWSPLTLRQESALLKRLSESNGPRIVLISAAPASGLAWLTEAVEGLINSPGLDWPKPRSLLPSLVDRIAEVAAVERRDAMPGKPKIIIIQGAWPSADTLKALRKDKTFRQTNRPVRLIWIGGPNADTLAQRPTSDVLLMSATPLSRESLLHWMNREALGYSDDEQVQRDLIAVSGGWLQPLDTTVVNANVRKRGPEVLTAAVAASAAKLTLADLGLDPHMALFAAALFKELGCTSVASSDLKDWAVHADALEGVKNLKVLETLGIVETVREARDQVMHAFNPLAARLLG